MYSADDGEPLVVFQHTRKTAGTSVRHVLHTNLAHLSFRVVQAMETLDWFREFWRASQVGGDRISCLAGHSANLVVPFVERPVRLFTMVREPVDRVVSRVFFHGAEVGTVDALFASPMSPGKAAFFLNGQARALLAQHHDTQSLPLLADSPGAEAWRERLREVANAYVLGLQERFESSLEIFARELGWAQVYAATARINPDRPTLDRIPDATRSVIREHNWLDVELWALAAERLDVAATRA